MSAPRGRARGQKRSTRLRREGPLSAGRLGLGLSSNTFLWEHSAEPPSMFLFFFSFMHIARFVVDPAPLWEKKQRRAAFFRGVVAKHFPTEDLSNFGLLAPV